MISLHHMSHPKIPSLLKLAVVPVWGFVTLSTVGLSVWLLNYSGRETVQSFVQTADASVTDPVYNLFAALPKRGEVLGQRVDLGDTRALKLRKFFEFYRSPLVGQEPAFVAAADKYQLPWSLLPAIACKESGCGRVIPVGSFNAFGWAVYSGQNSGAAFGSWEEAVDKVANGLRKNYFDRGYDTVEKIEVLYTPQSANSHGGWRDTVNHFKEELENWPL